MKIAKHLFDGLKLAALLGAVALVVWSMPEHQGPFAQQGEEQQPPATP